MRTLIGCRGTLTAGRAVLTSAAWIGALFVGASNFGGCSTNPEDAWVTATGASGTTSSEPGDELAPGSQATTDTTTDTSQDTNLIGKSESGTFALVISDFAIATIKDAPISLRLGAITQLDAALVFAIDKPPANGTVSDIIAIDESTARVTYSPAVGYVGPDSFTYTATAGSNTQSQLTELFVYPRVAFRVEEQAQGPDSVSFTAKAVTDDGAPLPEGIYSWLIDREASGGPVESNAEISRTLTLGGLHTVALSVTLAGLEAPYLCLLTGSADAGHANINVAPVISGVVRDAADHPLAGVAVSGEGVAVAATTSVSGRYRLSVPFDWSGVVTPALGDAAMDPPSRTYQFVRSDRSDQEYRSSVAFKLISGRVVDDSGAGIANVRVTAQGLPDVETSADGSFQFQAPEGWSGEVRPDGGDSSFDPVILNGSGDVDGTLDSFVIPGSHPEANNPPVAYSQAVVGAEDANKSITLTGSDPDGDPITYFVTSLPASGTLTDAGNSLVISAASLPYQLVSLQHIVIYIPNTNFNGGDSFLFRVSDGELASPNAAVTLTITPVNDAPVANPQQVSVAWATPKPINLTAIDVDNATLTFRVETQPAHGILSGTPPALTYTPNVGFQGPDNFTFTAYDGADRSAPATVTISVAAGPVWLAPIGIPAPVFGIDQVHTMYTGQTWDYGAGLEPYRNAGSGPYTHYVDSSIAQSTDTNNAYGSPAKPRKTVPQNLPAGSVVELHGGPYTYNVGGEIPLGGNGTSLKPVFIRGTSAAQKVMFSKPLAVTGQYVIIENIDLHAWSTSNDSGISLYGGVSNIALRSSEVRNGPNATTSAVAIGGNSHHLVIYGNKIHDNGNWLATYDQDHHGIGVGDASYIWAVDNEMYHNSGDGMQINGGITTTHHVYVGRNTAWENKQTGIWTKKASDVIFSQNTVHNHTPSDSSPGAGIGFQYGPERIWMLYNHIYNCSFGIMGASDYGSADDGQFAYAIGNVIHDIHAPVGDFDPTTAWSYGYAIHLRGCNVRYFINNTIYNCDAGMAGTYGGRFHFINNIVSNLSGANGRHIFVEDSFDSAGSTMMNNLLQGTVRISWDSATPIYTLSTFQAATGKGQGCINATPAFVNAAANDLHLNAGSPGVNNGTIADVYATFQARYGISIAMDYDRVARPAGSAWDMGAFER